MNRVDGSRWFIQAAEATSALSTMCDTILKDRADIIFRLSDGNRLLRDYSRPGRLPCRCTHPLAERCIRNDTPSNRCTAIAL